jgi:Kef-type K+ transport system membrane component KefB
MPLQGGDEQAGFERAMITENLIINLLLILTAAWALGALSVRIGLPVMLGELIAGLLLGPPLLGVVHFSGTLEFLAELGIFFAMFYAGMEMDPKALLQHIWPSLGVAVGGFVVPFVLGYLATRFFGGTVYQSLFVGMGLSVTAIAVGAVILQDMQIHKSRVGLVIMGAAIADDILSLITLSVLLGLAKSGTIQLTAVLLILAKVVLFFAFTIVAGHFITPFLTKKLNDFGGKGFTFAMICALLMAYAAELAGLHLVIGAFLAGQFVRKEIMDEKVYDAIRDRFFGISYGFLTPIFFSSLAFHVHFQGDWSFISLTVAITLAAIVGKVVGSGMGARLFGHSLRESVVIGFGMNGRGAVELVVATVVIQLSNELMAEGSLSAPLLTQEQFSALVLMAFVTTLLTPVLLKWSVARSCTGGEKERFCSLWEASKKKS